MSTDRAPFPAVNSTTWNGTTSQFGIHRVWRPVFDAMTSNRRACPPNQSLGEPPGLAVSGDLTADNAEGGVDIAGDGVHPSSSGQRNYRRHQGVFDQILAI